LCWFHRFYMVMRFYIFFIFKNEYQIHKFSKVYFRRRCVRHLIQTLHTTAVGLTNHRRQRLLDHLHAIRHPQLLSFSLMWRSSQAFTLRVRYYSNMFIFLV
jgi:hypothetical protein